MVATSWPASRTGTGASSCTTCSDRQGTWKQIAGYADKIEKAKFGPDGALYLLSRKDAPKGRILRLAPASPSLEKAEAVADQGEVSIQDFEPAAETLFTVDMAGGPSQMRLFDLKPFHRIADAAKPPVTPRAGGPGARELGTVPILPVSSVGQVLRLAGDEVLYRNQSYVEPPAWYRYRAGEAKAAKTALKQIPAADYADTEVVREFATSKDGTKIPVNILRRRGTKLDGSNPTILYGYGGYGVNITPRFSETRRVWIEQGGVYAVANLRGGGEYGEEWHLAGNLTKKQNVFDDFTAAAKHLVDSKYTSPGRLAIEGGSNGGLLMGAALTQHPAMFRAVVSHVGIYDSLRVELTPNGEFNTTEFGTVKNPDHFKALRAYSPYHNVHDGTQYPAVLFLTGANDPRVDPSNSRKMTARLQAANVSGLPVLLRTSMTSGHGIGSALSEEIAQQTDVYAFLFDQLGMEYRPVPNTGK